MSSDPRDIIKKITNIDDLKAYAYDFLDLIEKQGKQLSDIRKLVV